MIDRRQHVDGQLRLGDRVVHELEIGSELHQIRPVGAGARAHRFSGVLLRGPAPFQPDDAAPLLAGRVDEEDERVVEPVQQLALAVGEPEPEVEAPVRERQPVDVVAQLPRARGPADAAGVEHVRSDEQTRRRRAPRAGAAAARSRCSASIRSRSENGSPARNCCRSSPSDPTSRAAAIVASPVPHSRSPAARSAGIGVRRERLPVAHDRLVGRAVELEPTLAQQHRSLAEPLDLRRIVRDEDDRPAALLELEHLAEALALERLVADREHLVEQQHVRVQVRRDREAEPHVHPRRVGAHRPVDRLLELGEGDDLVEALADLGAAQARRWRR